MNITHYDLFAGIGGFSLALEEVFNEAKINHIFCEWEYFPSAVLKKHWPNGVFYGDIADLVADTDSKRHKMCSRARSGRTVTTLVGSGTGEKLRLQPAMPEWMMGFPEKWTEFPIASPSGGMNRSKPTETQ